MANARVAIVKDGARVRVAGAERSDRVDGE